MAKLRTLGRVAMTRGVADAIADNEKLAEEVTLALKRYTVGDWGDTDEEDKALNDRAALNDDERVVAKYETSEEPIFIITEYDRSVTTILFCSEY